MSERFVEAFLVAPEKLTALFGTPALSYDALAKQLSRKPIWEDMMMTLGDGDEDEGLPLIQKGLGELAAGKAPTIQYGHRLAALVLHANAEKLKPDIMECNYMPADDAGDWAPAFRALGMKTIAKQWARPNFTWPRKRAGKSDWPWPVFTIVDPASLETWSKELSTPWRAKLKTLPHSTFDPDADDDAEDAFMSRDEVAHGIAVVEKWVAAARKPSASKRKAVAKTGNSLVLILDGDQ